ncbi:hypothetical protein ACHAXR_002699, partial [Thalassiosira sp. AJA248-18]
MSAPQSQSSPSRPGSVASSIPMSYSMESDPIPTAAQPPSASAVTAGTSANQVPPAYAFQRSERTPVTGGRPGSFTTTEDSIDQSMDRSVDYTEDLSTSGGYEGLQQQQQQRQQQMGSGGGDESNLNQYYQYQEAQEGYVDQQNLATVNEYQAAGLQGINGAGSGAEGEDATGTIYQMHKKLLHLMSCPELFHDALDWQKILDEGFDPSIESTSENKDATGLTTFETEFEDDSTFRGLGDKSDDNQETVKATHSQNETFEFNPNNNNDSTKENPKEKPSSAAEDLPKPKEPPLPHQIFASDAEVVLPQALTASQLFGIERVTGVELEAAAGIVGLSQLFLRWLALMPEGDHMNVIDPPGLTVMKISGGGYRVTGAHRVVWRCANITICPCRWIRPIHVSNPFLGSLLLRWMNKFSPVSTGQSANDTDFDFGDLVSMTIIDVFETDVNGKLLSYCPTFDNRAVHKTPEMAERLRKGASHLKERMEVVARSPAGKSVGTFGKMSFRAAMVVGNAVKNKIQQQNQESD